MRTESPEIFLDVQLGKDPPTEMSPHWWHLQPSFASGFYFLFLHISPILGVYMEYCSPWLEYNIFRHRFHLENQHPLKSDTLNSTQTSCIPIQYSIPIPAKIPSLIHSEWELNTSAERKKSFMRKLRKWVIVFFNKCGFPKNYFIDSDSVTIDSIFWYFKLLGISGS